MAVPAASEVVDYARRLGPGRAILRSAYVLANRALPVSIFDCVRLAPEDVNDALAESDGPFAGGFVERARFEELAGELDQHTRTIVRGAFERGDACWVVLDGQRIANVGFYAGRPTPIVDDLVVHFDPRCRYMHGAFTPAAYRGRRLHALGILGAARALFGQGVPALLGVYERTNYRSMVSAHRMGWKNCGVLYRVGAGRRAWLGRTGAARAVGMWLAPRVEDGA